MAEGLSDARTEGPWLEYHTISSPGAFGSDEVNIYSTL